MINSYNIDSFMTPFLRIMYDGITYTFNTMEQFQFGGTNLLQVMITIMILGVAIPILLSLVSNVGSGDVADNYEPRHDNRAIRNRYLANNMPLKRENWQDLRKRGIL